MYGSRGISKLSTDWSRLCTICMGEGYLKAKYWLVKAVYYVYGVRGSQSVLAGQGSVLCVFKLPEVLQLMGRFFATARVPPPKGR